MMETIRNGKNKKVAEVDKKEKKVVIKSKECQTTIHFVDNDQVEVINSIHV